MPLIWVYVIEHAVFALATWIFGHLVTTSPPCAFLILQMNSHKLMDLFFVLIKLKAGKASPSDSLHWCNPLWLIRFFSVSVRPMKIYDFVERGKRVVFWHILDSDRVRIWAAMSLMLSEIFSGWMKVICIKMFKGDSEHTLDVMYELEQSHRWMVEE